MKLPWFDRTRAGKHGFVRGAGVTPSTVDELHGAQRESRRGGTHARREIRERLVIRLRRHVPQRSHTAWLYGAMFASKRAAPGDRLEGTQSPAAASASSVWYTVAKLIVGIAGRCRSKSSWAVGCVGSPASSRAMAGRCGVSFRPEARTRACISAKRASASGHTLGTSAGYVEFFSAASPPELRKIPTAAGAGTLLGRQTPKDRGEPHGFCLAHDPPASRTRMDGLARQKTP